jgi:hypothetical protein
MATAFDTMEFDPVTGQTKQKKQQQAPYMNPNDSPQGYLPYTGGNATQAELQQGNANVMGAAQGAALNQQQPQYNPIRQQTQQMTQNLMQNPSLGMNWDNYNKGQLSAFDADRAAGVQNYKEQTGAMGGDGRTQQNLLQLMMDQNTGRGQFANELEQQTYEKGMRDYLSAIGQGRTEADSLQASQSKAIDDLLKVRGAFEGEAGRQTQEKLGMADLTLREKQFSASLSQFTDEMSFKREALKAGATENEAQRMWQATEAEKNRALTRSESALDRAFTLSTKLMDQDFTKELETLKTRNQSGLMAQKQDYDVVLQKLDQASKEALQRGDLAGQKEIVALQAEITREQAAADRSWKTAERVASQGWQTGERIDEQDYQSAMKLLDQKFADAQKTRDFAQQSLIEGQREKLQLAMQTNDMQQQERMAFLNNEYATAMANGDVGRQMQIIEFQHTQEMDKLATQFGYDKALEYTRGEIQSALADKDFTKALTLQKNELTFREQEGAKDRTMEQARIDLQKAGVDMQKMEQTYNYLAGEVEAGRADPSTLTDFVNGVAKQAGVTITPPDPNAATKAAQKKYDDMLQQYAISHPESMVTTPARPGRFRGPNGIIAGDKEVYDLVVAGRMPGHTVINEPQPETRGLSPEGQAKFAEYFNSTVYGELTAEEKAAKATAGYLGKGDIATASHGDKINIDSATNYGGKSIPPGKYVVADETYKTGNDVFGKTTKVRTQLINEETGAKITLRTAEKGSDYGLFKTAIDPLKFFE